MSRRFTVISLSCLIVCGPALADWVDTGRKECGLSEETRDNHDHKCKDNCETCSPDREWCADRVTIKLDITTTPLRLKYFDPSVKQNCYAAVKSVKGGNTHWDVEGCMFSADLKTFSVDVIGFTYPQKYQACVEIQEFVP